MNNRILGIVAKIFINPFYLKLYSGRRCSILSRNASMLIPEGEELLGLDVGCGNGEITNLVKGFRRNLNMKGVDVLLRPDAIIDVVRYDGKKLPFADKSFDFVMLIDVLHHIDDPLATVRECARVARKFIIIKDHVCNSRWDYLRLSFMDWIGNCGFGVRLPYNYISDGKWDVIFKETDLICVEKNTKIKLYPKIISFIFTERLQFFAKLNINNKGK